MGWPANDSARSLFLSDALPAKTELSRPIQPAMSRTALRHLMAIEQSEEDRRLSAAAAFFMFLFGVGCGATWTLILTWLI